MPGEIYRYHGFHGAGACCEIEIRRHTGYTLVVATELPYNPGTSITNAAELLATEICRKYRIPPGDLVWVEHYPERGRNIAETWDLVKFDLDAATGSFRRPKWRRISAEDVEALRGGREPEGVSDGDDRRPPIPDVRPLAGHLDASGGSCAGCDDYEHGS